MLVCTQVVDPELACPRFFLRGFAVEKEDVRLHSLRIEDASGQAQEGVESACLSRAGSDGLPSPRLCKFAALIMKCATAQAFAGAAFEEDVIRQDDRGAAVLLEDGEDVLEKVEL